MAPREKVSSIAIRAPEDNPTDTRHFTNLTRISHLGDPLSMHDVSVRSTFSPNLPAIPRAIPLASGHILRGES